MRAAIVGAGGVGKTRTAIEVAKRRLAEQQEDVWFVDLSPLDPIKMLIWSAVINGVVAVPIMTVMMVIISKKSLMGRFRAKPWLVGFGWGGTALMLVAVVAMIGSSLM